MHLALPLPKAQTRLLVSLSNSRQYLINQIIPMDPFRFLKCEIGSCQKSLKEFACTQNSLNTITGDWPCRFPCRCGAMLELLSGLASGRPLFPVPISRVLAGGARRFTCFNYSCAENMSVSRIFEALLHMLLIFCLWDSDHGGRNEGRYKRQGQTKPPDSPHTLQANLS